VRSPGVQSGAGTPAAKFVVRLSPNETAEQSPALIGLQAIPAGSATRNLALEAPHLFTLGILWLGGAALMLCGWIASLAVRTRYHRQSRKVTGAPWLQPAHAVAGWDRVHHVRLHPGAVTPCVWGAWCPVLLLPVSALAWPEHKLQRVLAHECAHLLRRDPWWQHLGWCFLILFWFLPPAWSIVRGGRQAVYTAADDSFTITGFPEVLRGMTDHFHSPGEADTINLDKNGMGKRSKRQDLNIGAVRAQAIRERLFSHVPGRPPAQASSPER